MRLTAKDKTSLNYKLDYGSLFGTCGQEMYDKLGQLEDIEDELGIDLITLFKALKNGIFAKHESKSKGIAYIDGRNLEFKFEPVPVIDVIFPILKNSNTGGTMLYFKDYGKTWALTKEELENE